MSFREDQSDRLNAALEKADVALRSKIEELSFVSRVGEAISRHTSSRELSAELVEIVAETILCNYAVLYRRAVRTARSIPSLRRRQLSKFIRPVFVEGRPHGPRAKLWYPRSQQPQDDRRMAVPPRTEVLALCPVEGLRDGRCNPHPR